MMKKFDAVSINGYTRKTAYSRKLPKVKRVVNEELKFVKDWKSINPVNVFELNHIPSETDLLNWRCRLRNMSASAVIKPIVLCDHGTFTTENIEDAIKLHTAKVIHRCVVQEISWFQSPVCRPHSVSEHPSPQALANFQDLIMNTPRDIKITSLGMTPDELARLCNTRYLSGDHIHWFVNKLNSITSETHCIYLNSISNVGRYVEQKVQLQPPPDNLSFIISVGSERNGNVYIGSDTNPGNHWTFLFYKASNHTLTYGDSLGWAFPSGLLEKACEYIKKIYHNGSPPSLTICHDPESNDSKGRHFCNGELCRMYPLQTCYNICGPIAILVMVISAISKHMFDVITGHRSSYIPYLYITEPTKYNKYIRQVLMSWIAEGCINIKNIVPNAFLQRQTVGPNLRDHLASDSDDGNNEETFMVNFSDNDTIKHLHTYVPNVNGTEEKFHCNICHCSYSRRNDLKRHIRKKHCICLECGHRCRKIENLREHLLKQHSMKMDIEHLKFENLTEFKSWKCDLEERSKCTYIKCSGIQDKKDGTSLQHLKCNRSGKFKSRRIGKRRMKSSGMCKLEKNCTSTIRICTLEDGKLEVVVCYTHYGHSIDLEHIRFTKRQKQEIASKLSQGVSRDKILDDIRNEVGSDFMKVRLLDKQDIRNIRRAYNVECTRRHENDQQSVLAWIREWENSENNPVLYYNLKRQQPEFSCMKKEDFMIIIQTEAQRMNLRKFGASGICADATHDTTGNDLLLSTLLVVDEFGHGQPAGWCLATRETEGFLKIFFDKIVENSGKIIPRWFMSNMAPQYYKAFCSANECTPKRLLCTWHVDKAWKAALKDKVQNSAIEAELYLKLRTLLEITNENLFETALHWLVKAALSSNVTKAFAEYFERNWVPFKRQWGYCFRAGDGINTNMFVEAFHHTLKYSYLHGKHNKRLDNLLLNLMKFSRDQVVERLIRVNKGKQITRQKIMGDRHLASHKMNVTGVTKKSENIYVVKSESLENISYMITEIENSCEISNCIMKCTKCSVCPHTFDCTCPDFLIEGTSCKHVHLVKSYLDAQHPLQQKQQQQQQQQQHTNTFKESGYAAAEITDTFDIIREERPNKFEEFSNYKEKVETQLHSLQQEVESCSSSNIKAIKHLHKKLIATTNTFQGMMLNIGIPKLVGKNNIPANKSTEVHSKIKCVKQKSKNTERIRLPKLTHNETNELLTKLSGKSTSSEIIYSDDEKKILQLLKVDQLPTGKDLPLEHEVSGEITEYDVAITTSAIKKYFDTHSWVRVLEIVRDVYVTWKCPVCEISKFEVMIQCKVCEVWFHWSCISCGNELPTVWSCQKCRQKCSKEATQTVNNVLVPHRDQ